MEHIIFGKPYTAPPFVYWYAFIILCEHLGKSLATNYDIKFGYDTDLVDQVLQSDFGIKLISEELLMNNKPSFSLPENKSFPAAGFWDKNELQRIKELFKDIHITDEQLEKLEDEDYDRYDGTRIIKKIKDDVDYCLENDLVLISFCH